MSAFGVNRFTQAFAVAVNAAGTRIADKPISCVDRLASDLFEWNGNIELKDFYRFIYPFVGGTAVSNSFNLADPSTARIAWNPAAVIVHNVNGWTSDSSNNPHGDTGVRDNPITINSYACGWGVYCRTANAVAGIDIVGNYSATPQSSLIASYFRNTDGKTYYWWGSNVTSPPNTSVSVATPNSQGLFTAFRNAPSIPGYYCYRNGTNIASSSVAVGVVAPTEEATTNWWLAWNGLGRNYAFAFLEWDHVTHPVTVLSHQHAAQASLYNIVQGFQARVGRAV